MKVTKRTKFKATDLLAASGFIKSPIAPAGSSDPFYYWNRDGLAIATRSTERWTIAEFHFRIRNQAAYQTRRRIRRQMDGLELGEKGYVAP